MIGTVGAISDDIVHYTKVHNPGYFQLKNNCLQLKCSHGNFNSRIYSLNANLDPVKIALKTQKYNSIFVIVPNKSLLQQ